jgi:hypothetical protein
MVFNRALKEEEVKLLCRTMGVKCRDMILGNHQ